MEDIIKIVTSLEDSGLLLKRVSDTIQNEVKEQKGGFLSMFLGTSGTSLLGNILAGKVSVLVYLYYPLNVEGVTRKGSFLPAHIR